MFFVLVVVVLLLIPITKINTKETNTIENRALAIQPTLVKENYFNGNYGKEFEAWLNDRFRYRDKLIDAYYGTESFLTNRIENAKAFVGKENWLFSKEEGSVDLYQNKVNFNDSEMAKIKINLEQRKQWLNSKGIEFFVVIPPDKSSVYGEFYKDSIIKVKSENRMQLLEKYLKENDAKIEINYLLDVLMDHKKDGLLYYKTDTHWGEYGAYIGYLDLMEDIKNKFPDVYILSPGIDIKIESKIHPQGDLTAMLGIDNPELYNDKYVVPEPTNGYNFVYIENNGAEGVKTHNPIRKLKVLVFRDSFAIALTPYLSESFGYVEYIWGNKLNDYQDKIIQEKPDIVIYEVVSRYTDILLHDAPELKGGGK